MISSPPATPLVQVVLEKICEELRSGQYQMKEPLPTQREWAGRLKVSPFTVSRALEILKKRGVIAAAEGSYTFLAVNPEEISPDVTTIAAAPVPASAASAAGTEIYTWRYDHGNAKFRDVLAAKQFETFFSRQHPSIRVRERFYDSQRHDSVQHSMTAVLTGPEPTYGKIPGTYLSMLVRQGAVASLDTLGVSSYFERLKPSCRQACSCNGHPYLLPTTMSYSVLFVNRKIFRKAGLDPERVARDWDEFHDILRRLSDLVEGPSLHIHGLSDAIWWLTALTHQASEPVSAPVLPRIDWDSQAARSAIDFFHQLIFQDKLVDLHLQDSALVRSLCLADRFPIFLGHSAAAQAAALGEAGRFALAPLPPGPNGQRISLLNCAGWYVNGNATLIQQQAAATYIVEREKWGHDESGARQMRELGLSPSVTSVYLESTQDSYLANNLPAEWLDTFRTLENQGRWESAGADWQKAYLAQALNVLMKQMENPTPEIMRYHFRLAEDENSMHLVSGRRSSEG